MNLGLSLKHIMCKSHKENFVKFSKGFFLVGVMSVFFMLFAAQLALANSYIADINYVTSKIIYNVNERIELKGSIYLSNYTGEGILVSGHAAVSNSTLNMSIINKNTNALSSSYQFNTTSTGEFYSRSDYFPNAALVSAPSAIGDYYIIANYTDLNNYSWWTRTEIQVINKTIDKLIVSTDKVSYGPSESITVLVEAVKEVGESLTYIENVIVTGSVLSSSKSELSTFSCTTLQTGKCQATLTAPSSYGDYYIQVNNYKAYTSFEVKPFSVIISMKDNLGESVKHTFTTSEQASVEVGVITNSTTEAYSFDGVIKDSAGTVVKNVTSTELNYNNSYINRFTFTLDAINFQPGSYFVYVNATKSTGSTVAASTSFEIESWDLMLKKKETNSGFEYEYSTFPSKLVYLEFYPTWRGNGSVITSINTTTSVNISLSDSMNNILSRVNATFNASCATEGCYGFSLITPSNVERYTLSVTVSYNGEAITASKKINAVSSTIFAQTTDKDGSFKELFGTNEYVYLSLSAKNSTASSVNLSNVSISSIAYMNSSESNYTQVGTFELVNSSNINREWAWNSTLQRLKIDAPSLGGVYTVHITAENNTIAASIRFILNPFDACIAAKNTAGQAGGSTGYYYVYQFKTTDTVNFELKLTQANNPLGRAAFANTTNSSYGRGSACADQSSTKQVINNATVTIDEIVNTYTGKKFSLNSSVSSCQSDDTKGAYTCTVKATENWDSGSYSVKFRIQTQDSSSSDIAYGYFDARSFYLYAWSTNWRNKPSSSISLNVYMYEAGDNWWGNYGSGGLSGTVTVEKIEYNGKEGEWIYPPLVYDYNVSALNTTTVTNGNGILSLPVNYTASGTWKPGSYKVILKGTDNGGKTDYGYASFEVRRWETYASPVECSGGSCYSTYNINSRSNISLYVTINNAGETSGQSGNNLGGNVTVRVKKINDCRKWPCAELNSSLYNATSIIVNSSSGWYWSGSINPAYLINITPLNGRWGTGYWQVTFDLNNTETGNGWFNTIAFYAEAQPTNSAGTSYKYSVKNTEPMYFKITATKTQKGGYYTTNYITADYINATIDSAVLRRWDQTNYKQTEYTYPTYFNISIVNGGTLINGTRVINVTYLNGSWPSGYYYGEITLKNQADNDTGTAYLWSQVRPFRVQVNSNQYSIDNTACINGTIYIYEPDWNTNTVLNGTYNITGVTERTWSSSGSTSTAYTNFTPITFNGTNNFRVCPSTAKWSTGSGDGYHYLSILVKDNQSNSDEGWLSFRIVPFSISWGSITGGTNVRKSSSLTAPVTLTKASTGASTTGNLTKVYQWRYDNYASSREEYVFSIGNCYSNVSGTCNVSGTASVTIYPPSGGWKDGYNYLQAEWTESDDATSKVRDYSGVWFNGVDTYTGWWNNADESGNWKYNFALNENISIKLYVNTLSGSAATVNITKIEYSTPSSSCWNDNCRTYNTASYSVVGQSHYQIIGSGIVRIAKPSNSNWSRGTISIRATISSANGTLTSTIKDGNVYAKDLTGPSVTLSSPATGDRINSSSFWINWSTSEAATCWINVYNYANFYSWYCGSSWYNISTQSFCNNTRFSGATYITDYISRDYHSWYYGGTWGYSPGSTGLQTGTTTHYYNFSTASFTNQDYGLQIYCNDEDWNYGYGWAAIKINTSNSIVSTQVNVTLLYPTNNLTIDTTPGNQRFNYTFSGVSAANCSIYGNSTGTWAANLTSNNINNGTNNFTLSWINGNYLWNVYCIETSNSSNYDWGDQNRTVKVSYLA